jgi:ATP synthase protein I
MGAEPGRPGGRGADRRQAADSAAVGIQFTGTILVFLFAGRWLDGRLGTDPWLLLLGLFLGFVLGTLWIYRRLMAGTPGGKPR